MEISQLVKHTVTLFHRMKIGNGLGFSDDTMQTAQEKLNDLEIAICLCRKCLLYKQRLHAVPGEGNPKARIVLIGEAPGVMEDRNGRPFIGSAGKFLNQLFIEYDNQRDDLFLTSCVKCRPPGNRTPKRKELDVCMTSWLLPQLQLIKPEIVVLCGRTAVQQMLGKPVKITDIHGTFHQRDGQYYFITYHPAAGMRFPVIAADMRLDFKRLAEFMIGVKPFEKSE